VYRLTGTIRYGNSWAWVECPYDVGAYYRHIVKWLSGKQLSSPLNGAHITLVAGKYEANASTHPMWRAHEGKPINFTYGVLSGIESYYWLTIEEDSELRNFRRELDLPPELKWPFHLTIGKENP